MAPPLTVRNLTSTAIELKLIERYESPTAHEPEAAQGLGNFTRNLTNLVANTTNLQIAEPSAPKLAENAKSFAHQDVSIRIDAFASKKTDIKATERSNTEILRVTIESEGQKYRIDTPSPKDESQTFTPLAQNAKHAYTGIFLPATTHLTIFSSANLNCWMKELKNETPLSALSIPGTHNSPTCHRALPSVRCQAVSPREQLDNGVRFFDIRVQPESPQDAKKDGLILVHSVFPISLTGNKYFRDLINEVEDFLQRNPSETVIISLKREGPGEATDQQLSRILHDHYANDSKKWFTEPRIPRLGEARGKIVLFRRFVLDDAQKKEHGGKGWGINAESWADNTPNNTHDQVCVQDFYEVLDTMNIDKKIKYAEDHLLRSGSAVCPVGQGHPEGKPGLLYVNFLSASNFWKVGCWPDKIAAKMNPAMVQFLCEKDISGEHGKGDGCTGVVVCDWVGDRGDWDLVRCIVGMNGKLEMREKRR
ncbi:phosphatidylinositol phospholipase C [Rhizodiscina lignyota]|uniref:Phosphatidylinositol phospholipase C n=1 Tax=Rhizodiscina lignyota TaxID=1504668 RepID=A0A9P4IA03_9PEZI|nr:phosphatidylinositol phospholipase C [Rhizodiscina lignyota]